MCYRDRGPVFCKLLQTVLDPAFTFIIQSTGGLIQDQDRRILQKNTGNGDPLLLPSGQTRSTLSHKAVITIRQRHNKVVNICLSGSILNLLHRGPRLTVCNILPDRTTEQINILLHQTNLIPKTFQCQFPDILSINTDTSSRHIVKPRKQRAYRGLAAAGRSHQSHRFSRLNLKGYIRKHQRVIIAVMKGYLVIFHGSFDIFQRLCIRGIHNIRLCLHDCQKTPET